MKKAIALVAALAALAVVVTVACDIPVDEGGLPGTDGLLTVTGLEGYNGKYIYCATEGSDPVLVGVVDVNMAADKITLTPISGGKAEIKIYEVVGEETLIGYSGSDTVTVWVLIFASQTPSSQAYPIAENSFRAVFKSGMATVAYTVADTLPPTVEGTFTVTGIPEQWNGKYAMAFTPGMLPSEPLSGEDEPEEVVYIIGATASLMEGATTVLIEDGTVAIPLWHLTDDGTGSWTGVISGYTGSDTVSEFLVFITNEEVIVDSDAVDYAEVVVIFDSVTFSDGSATKAWSEGTSEEMP
jgi:hypothetical protein